MSERQAPDRGFSDTEYVDRTRRAQVWMVAENIAGILLTTEPEIRYFTGFHTLFWQSPTRPWFVFLPVRGKPVAIIPEIGAALMARTWIEDIRTWSAPCPADDGISLLRELLAPLAASGQVVGLLMGPETNLRMPLGDFHRLMEGLPGVRTIDATPIIRELRMTKSDAEIQKLAHVCAIASDTFDGMASLAREGQGVNEVFRAFKIAALSHGADDVPYLVGGAGPGGYADVISPPDLTPLRRGDVLMLDTGCVWDGYFSDFDRNFAIGVPCDVARRAYEVLWEATQRGIDAARPGARCCDVHRAMQDVIARIDPGSGSGAVGRLGHGLGIQLTEWPSLTAEDETVLADGMVITLEPSLALDHGKTMVHEENIVVRETGVQLLSRRAPPELPVI